MEEKKKINFFTRLKTAIFKLEDYGIFLGEKISTSLKYFFIIVFMLSIVSVLIDTYNFNEMFGKGYNYVKNELPDFTYISAEDGKEGTLQFENVVTGYDEKYNFNLIIDTSEEIPEAKMKEYKNNIYNGTHGLIFLKNKVIYIVSNQEKEFTYSYLQEYFSIDNLENKEALLNKINAVGASSIIVTYTIFDLIIIYITNIVVVFGDILVIAVFGWIAARLCGLKFKMVPMISLSIYSISLSIILTAIYSIVYNITGFVINYFNIMYLLIAYVYIIAAIMMIKYDLIKQHFEVEKIIEVQKQVHEELEEKKKEDEEKEKNKDKDPKKEPDEDKNKKDNKDGEEPNLNTREPDGSEI